jgi:hypothetical protein
LSHDAILSINYAPKKQGKRGESGPYRLQFAKSAGQKAFGKVISCKLRDFCLTRSARTASQTTTNDFSEQLRSPDLRRHFTTLKASVCARLFSNGFRLCHF